MNFKVLLIVCFIFFSFKKLYSQTYIDSIIKSEFYFDEKAVIGKEFCVFESTTLKNEPISNTSLVGKITIVNLWFEGCAPCIVELEALINLFNKYNSNNSFQFFSFTIDDEEVARKAVNKYEIPYIVSSISSVLAHKMNFNKGFPTNMIISKEGKIIYYKGGGYLEKTKAEIQIAEMDEIISRLLREMK